MTWKYGRAVLDFFERERERERERVRDSQNDRELYTRGIVRAVFVLFLFLRALR